MTTVYLFDIDGTLLSTGGAGQRAMERALATVFGVSAPTEEILAAGRTDRAITADLFAHHKISPTAAAWTQFQAAYFAQLPETLAELRGRVLPGIVDLLEALSARADVAVLGLLTGNFREGARLKLQHFAIDHHFAFGGYGDEHPHRDDVARVAVAEAEQHLGRTVPPERIWVIGDTPADVQCARAIGARAVAVATGIFGADELHATQPDFLFADFADTQPVLNVLLG